jgi:hypothetical protein
MASSPQETTALRHSREIVSRDGGSNIMGYDVFAPRFICSLFFKVFIELQVEI